MITTPEPAEYTGNLTTNTLKVTDDKRASVIVEGKGEKSIYLHTTDGQGGAFLSLEEGDGYKTVLGPQLPH